MPHIIFPSQPASIGVGRQARNACIDPITGEYACEVDGVAEGETEITAEQHAAIRAAAELAYEQEAQA